MTSMIDLQQTVQIWRHARVALGGLLLLPGVALADDGLFHYHDQRDTPSMEFRLGLFVERGDFGEEDQAEPEDLGGLGILLEYLDPRYGARLSYASLSFDDDNAFSLTDGRFAVFGHTGLEEFRAEAGVQLKRISLELDDGFHDPRILDEHFGFGAFIGGHMRIGPGALYTETGYTFYDKFDGLELAFGGRVSFGAFEVFAELREQYLREDRDRQELSTVRMGMSFAFSEW